MKRVEAAEGRDLSGSALRWGPRPLDLDLLTFGCDPEGGGGSGGVVMETRELVLPHPRMAERDFVLVPMCDVAPKMVRARGVGGGNARTFFGVLGRPPPFAYKTQKSGPSHQGPHL